MGTAVHWHIYSARILKQKQDSLYIKGEFAPNLKKLTRNDFTKKEEIEYHLNLNTSNSEESVDQAKQSEKRLQNKSARRSNDKNIDTVHRKKFLLIKDTTARLKLFKKSSDSIRILERDSEDQLKDEFTQKRPDPSI